MTMRRYRRCLRAIHVSMARLHARPAAMIRSRVWMRSCAGLAAARVMPSTMSPSLAAALRLHLQVASVALALQAAYLFKLLAACGVLYTACVISPAHRVAVPRNRRAEQGRASSG